MNKSGPDRFLLPRGNPKRWRFLTLVLFLVIIAVIIAIGGPVMNITLPAPLNNVVGATILSVIQFLVIFALTMLLMEAIVWIKGLWDRLTAWKRLPTPPEEKKP